MTAQAQEHKNNETNKARHADTVWTAVRPPSSGQQRAEQARAADEGHSWRGGATPRGERPGGHGDYSHVDLYVFLDRRNEGMGRGQEQGVYLHALWQYQGVRRREEKCGAPVDGGRRGARFGPGG